MNASPQSQTRPISFRRLLTQSEALQLALAEATVSLSGYFDAVDLGPGVSPQHHRVGQTTSPNILVERLFCIFHYFRLIQGKPR
jgi:hypothetical protein